ncbi:hypothetical protein [uncultured Litoreibacter sp.]|uniref:hypothetical protein n=1 Tax=uncultured Litoreibacter sp. TaxID=1392394 RepID=UPI0026138EF3|nr:hypothetical protein [uncultured Litoreibacter sp.]
MKTLTLIATATTLALSQAAPVYAAKGDVLDRIEDRIDRREDRIDRQTNNGPRDLIEDRIDRRESRRDRRGLDSPNFVNRWERRSWRRIIRNNASE